MRASLHTHTVSEAEGSVMSPHFSSISKHSPILGSSGRPSFHPMRSSLSFCFTVGGVLSPRYCRGRDRGVRGDEVTRGSRVDMQCGKAGSMYATGVACEVYTGRGGRVSLRKSQCTTYHTLVKSNYTLCCTCTYVHTHFIAYLL